MTNERREPLVCPTSAHPASACLPLADPRRSLRSHRKLYNLLYNINLRPARRRAPRGVTLVEVLIVVMIMALISGGVGFLVLPQLEKARIKTATTNARNIRQVAIQYIALEAAGDCPTVDKLISAKQLDASGGQKDPWDQEYKIVCEGDDVAVSSPGPDKKEGTEDDIYAGPSAGAGEG